MIKKFSGLIGFKGLDKQHIMHQGKYWFLKFRVFPDLTFKLTLVNI